MTLKTITRDCVSAVRAALIKGGELECPTRVTKSTGKLRYVPDADGFRIHLSVDPIFVPRSECCTERWYVWVRTSHNRPRTLARYAKILNAAGFATQTTTTHFRPTCVGVWITTPIVNETTDEMFDKFVDP